MPVGWNCTNSMSIRSAPASIRQRLAVARVFPAVAGDLERAADAAGREHDGLRLEHAEAAALAVVAERARDALAVLEQLRAPCTPCRRRCPGGCRGPAACGSSRGRCDRRRGRGAGSWWPPKLRCRMRPSFVRSNTAPHASSSRTRSGASLACSSAMRQLFRYWPPRIVSAKCTFQLSRSSTFASAAAMPPSAITVCALPSSDLQTSADRGARRRRPRSPRAGRRRRRRSTRTSCSMRPE